MAWLAAMLLPVLAFCVCAGAPAQEEQQVEKCVKRPRTESPKTPADGRFMLSIEGLIMKEYLPGNSYHVILNSTNNSSYFTTFLIMADGEYVEDKTNHRIHYNLLPGALASMGSEGQPHPHCPTTIQHTNNSPKNKVEVEWTAPPKSQGCVTIHAMVAESSDVWYMDDPPLSVKVCEDKRIMEDIKPQAIPVCKACEHAKYELTFEGLWSPNTHPNNFPVSASRRYSDMVGASHSDAYELWEYNKMASPGLKLLAEAGNTTIMEEEIQSNIGLGVRTVIKASGREGNHMSEATSAIFRVDSTHHLISLATSVVPSPDWFLGVSQFELCFENNTWVDERVLNLYLNDAGTDNGVSYESSNEETLPPLPVTAIRERSDNRNSPFFDETPGTLRPFARMRVKLLRLYRETCRPGPTFYKISGDQMYVVRYPLSGRPVDRGNEERTDETTAISENTTPVLNEDDCPVSEWHEWSECYPQCGADPDNYPGARNRFRERYHLVNGEEFGYIRENPHDLAPPSRRCEMMYEGRMFESEDCENCSRLT